MSSIKFSREKASKEKKTIEELRNTLKELLENQDEGVDNSIEINTIKKDIEFFQNKKAQASIFRSRCNWSQHTVKNLPNTFST